MSSSGLLAEKLVLAFKQASNLMYNKNDDDIVNKLVTSLKNKKETFTDEFIPAFENPNDGFEVKNIPYSDGVENLSTLFDNKDFKTNNFFK